MAGYEGLLTGHTLVGRYTIGPVIGRGGFAAVYEATDERLGRTVAVKVITLAAEGAEAEELRRRFDREARASASLHHPNVVAVYDFGTDPELGLDFLVMERLVGEDLRARMRRPDRLSLGASLRVLRDAADGVDAGHRIGLIHRDLKPGNIFLAQLNRPDWFRVCVVDFGIARIVTGDDTTRITHRGTPLSPAYASPEQLRGDDDLTPASDVFSLGVIGYELLSGTRPFAGDRLHPPDGGVPAPRPLRELNPAVPDAVAEAIHRALADDVDRRFPDAGAFAAALGRAEARWNAAPGAAPPADPASGAVPIADEPERSAAPPAAEQAAVAVPVPLPVDLVAAAEHPSAPRIADEPAPDREPQIVPAASRAPAEVPQIVPVAAPPPAQVASPALPVMRTEAASAAVPPVEVRRTEPAGVQVGGRGGMRPIVWLVAAVVAGLALWFGTKAMRGDASGRGDAIAAATPAGQTPVRQDSARAARTGSAPSAASSTPAGEVGSPGGRAPTAAPAGVAAGVAAPVSAPDEPVVATRTAASSPPPPPPAPARPQAPSGASAARAAAANAQGQTRFEQGDVPGAVERFRQAVELAPGSAAYRNNLAWALFQAGDQEGAAGQIAETLRLDSRRAIAYANLGELRAARGDRAGAVAAYQRFLELNTDPRREQIAREKLRRLQGG